MNGDGNITAGDAIDVYNHLLNNDTTNDSYYEVNGDGVVTAADKCQKCIEQGNNDQ